MAFNMSKWDRLVWTWRPASEREAGDSVVRNLLLHWFPAKVTKASLSIRYSIWLGTISALLFGILTVTGAILMFLYVPSVERAYASVKDLEFAVSFGWFIRAVHRISAHLMVAVVFLHMLRVFWTGAYKNGTAVNQNRPFNWLLGIGLLLVTFLLSFTGYLLPWDQLAYWAITVGTNIASAAPLVGEKIRFLFLGGNEIGQNTLLRFYVLHCFFLPLAVLFLFSWHMWRVRKDGGLACVDRLALEEKNAQAAPVASKTYSLLGIAKGRTVHVETSLVDHDRHTVPSSPNLTRRLLAVTLITLAVVAALAVFVGAPLEEAANPRVTPNPAKAPWYFLWLQELVTDTTIKIGGFTVNGALVGGILLPGVLVLLLGAWPYLDKSSVASVGVWFAKERRKQDMIFLAIVIFILVFTVIGTFLRGPYWKFYWPWQGWPEVPGRF
ncbi:MAG: cytochrome b N-terminal domain-containing protein [Bryobacterales bacterium]|nr:cytochrome b N-terminal domain-containing protein [Bryobacterales bacterium]